MKTSGQNFCSIIGVFSLSVAIMKIIPRYPGWLSEEWDVVLLCFKAKPKKYDDWLDCIPGKSIIFLIFHTISD